MRHLNLSRVRPFVGPVILSAVIAGAGGYAAGVKKSPSASVEGADLAPLWKAWDLLDRNYYGGTDKAKEVNGAIAGLVASVKDPYTVYLEPSQSTLFQDDLKGEFGGIGAELSIRDSQLVIQSVLSGTPAEKAGLKALDVIAKIDGQDVPKMAFNDAISAIRGNVGSTVVLTISRPSEDAPRDVSVVRDTITVKSVTTDVVGASKNIAYIKVAQFGGDTAEAFKAALGDAVTSGKKGAVIDLRNNPGGYLEAAQSMIGMVIPSTVDSDKEVLKKRTAVLVREKDGTEDAEKAGSEVVSGTLPLVVLVNGGSASASEIFAGAMKDYGRARVIGTQTFGKGSVQDLLALGNGGTIKVTIAKWFTPLGTGIDGTGIAPDSVVELPAETVASTSDAQAQKAIDLLSE